MKTHFFPAEYVDRPPAEVFAALSDPTLAPTFRPNVIRSEKLSTDPLGVGTRFRETRLLRGREVTSELVISRFEPDSHVSMCRGGDGIVVIDHYTLMPQASGTWIDWSRQFLARGPRMLILPIIAATLKPQDLNHVWQLKVQLESG